MSNMDWSSEDYVFMARAIQLAKRGLYSTQPNPRVGCVIVEDDEIISEGWHEYAGEPHAEINALRHCSMDLANATVYVTLEPCCHYGKTPPCSQSLIERGVKQVTVAMLDPNPLVKGQGMQELEAAGIKTASGLLEQQARGLNLGFIKRMQSGVPYVRSKLAVSLDGKIALNNGDSSWISSEHSRRDVQFLRAQSSAILTGVNTVLQDDPLLTVRLDELNQYQPLRVILDTHLRTPNNAKLFSSSGDIVIFTANDDDEKINDYTYPDLKIVVIETKNGSIDVAKALQWLATHKQVNDVLVEAGAELTGALLKQHLIDELIVYQANTLLGDKAKSLVSLPELISMNEKHQLTLKDQRYFSEDSRMTFSIE